MPRPYRLSGSRRLINMAIKPLARLGLAGRHTYVLAVRGRKKGRRYETPVSLIEDGDRWLVAPYGEVAWVRNARAAGEIELTRARRTERFRIEEVPAQEAASVRSGISRPGGPSCVRSLMSRSSPRSRTSSAKRRTIRSSDCRPARQSRVWLSGP